MWAAVASAGINLIGGLLGSSSSKKAAKAAAEAQQRALEQQLAYQRESRDKIYAYADPFYQTGTAALNRLNDPNANFQASPDYQFRLGQGLAGVTQNRAVGGMLRSGSALRGLSDYAQNTASNEFGNWYGRQRDLVNVGTGAMATLAGATSAFGNNASNIAGEQGRVQADYIGQRNQANQQMIGALTAAGSSLFNLAGGGQFGGAGGMQNMNPNAFRTMSVPPGVGTFYQSPGWSRGGM